MLDEVVIQPVVIQKALGESKSRLRGHLDEAGRRSLVTYCLERTLQSLAPYRPILLARGPLDLHFGSRVDLVQQKGEDLNQALSSLVQLLVARGVSAVLVVPGDLPFIEGLGGLLEAGGEEPIPALAPDQRVAGTNLLLAPTAPGFKTYFGTSSFQLHLQSLRARFGRVRILSNRTAFDIDTAGDLDLARQLFPSSPLWSQL